MPLAWSSLGLSNVKYAWKEYSGSDWTVSKTYEGYFGTSPSTFTTGYAYARMGYTMAFEPAKMMHGSGECRRKRSSKTRSFSSARSSMACFMLYRWKG